MTQLKELCFVILLNYNRKKRLYTKIGCSFLIDLFRGSGFTV